MKELDARGLDCPEPVVKTKQALGEADKVVVSVDDQVQADNVAKLAKKLNAEVAIVEQEDHYQLTIEQQGDEQEGTEEEQSGKVYFLTSDPLGEGEEKLGTILTKGFISTLLDVRPLPDKIIFMNSGVKIPTLNQQAIDDLKELEEQGVNILSCGTCLDYYEITEELAVGEISNMYEILSALNSGKVVEV
ncbi:sulfurtransferase-like selenium metabolism protein YedF [Halanaerobacter jeridensis]|uniref:Selenium metabolism protein YedF n=1 Tax=Halanaerobacter jeridensis TaxID=706427 RepID=A0A938XX76_9FIRM|nr:sulfurtransferase-like selenium metabolism protein YedF [Halanaerobacter jeridensis]MBM7557312.1 selenium metabolism protein YedF [Halanaerobacter jeridensis]